MTDDLTRPQNPKRTADAEGRKVISYWRNSLADANRMSVVEAKASRALTALKADVRAGRLDQPLADELFRQYAEEMTRGDDTGVPYIPVLVCPVRARLRYEHGVRRRGWLDQLYPLWMPAVLHRTGELTPPEQGLPWLSRDLLDPLESERSNVTIGSVEGVDAWLAAYPWPPRDEHGQPREPAWGDVWDYACDLLADVTRSGGRPLTVYDFNLEVGDLEPAVRYEMGLNSGVLLDTSMRAAGANILKLYDHIADRAHLPQLLERYASRTDLTPRPLLDGREAVRTSGSHCGQMSHEKSLSPSQREAMHHLLHLAEGEVLAVNGPPGTGKTTLLQSVVATLWVEHALAGGDPPVIVAASTNNQAVTNVIDSFGEGDEPQTPLAGRWLLGVTSYGMYCASIERMREAPARGILAMNPDGAGFPATIQTEEYLTKATSHFLAACGVYFDAPCESVEDATRRLHERLVQVVGDLRRGIDSWLALSDLSARMEAEYGGAGGLTSFIDEHGRLLGEQRLQIARTEVAHLGWLKHDAARPFWMTLFGWLPAVRNQRRSRIDAYLKEAEVEADGELADEAGVSAYFGRHLKRLKESERAVAAALERATEEQAALADAQEVWDEWRGGAGVEGGPPELLDRLDTTLRYEAFKLTTHYWEGRWLLEMREQFESGYEEKQFIQTPVKQTRKWLRYAKLTPCFVSTLYMAPKFFNAFQGADKPLYEFIDLLIIDEAGQVSPEVAGATFALAKKALVVGDTLQIEPVWSIPPKVDQGNLLAHKVIAGDAELAEFRDAGMSAASGSVMKIAQRQSSCQKYTDDNARGMFLSEHRRCVPDIIAYCNELAYAGRLEPKRPLLADYPLPHMGYAHVPGLSSRDGGSRANVAEAEVIAKWIAERRGTFSTLYEGKSLGEVVAVVTPFKRQKVLIQEKLRRLGVEGLTVGTVHALQGAERHVIIFSPVYGGLDPSMPFIDEGVNMLNVAVSRAQDSFLVFGNMERFNSDAAALPSGKLARHLFSGESNEITDIEVPARVLSRPDTVVQRLRTLEDHREALADSIARAVRGVWIASPYISSHAIEADALTGAVRRAVGRGVTVTVYVDATLNRAPSGAERKAAAEGRRMLADSGAVVKVVRPMHNKTICVDRSRLIEGSFNWLSARRGENDQYQRYECSLWYEGGEVAGMIEEAINDIEKLAAGAERL
jgi:energy-coupling factor transporter ATP-binding protein EcfA2